MTARPNASCSIRHDAPLEASGLPARILKIYRRAGCRTLEALSKTPPPDDAARLDDDSQALLKRVRCYLEQVFDNHPPDLSFHDWLHLFLPPRLAAAIQGRYALDSHLPTLQAHQPSLATAGRQLGITRERTRQLLQTAADTLTAPVPAAAAQSILQAAQKQIRKAGGVLIPAEAEKQQNKLWRPYSPIGSLLLLHDLFPEYLHLYRGFFTTWTADELDTTEKVMRDALNASGEPIKPLKGPAIAIVRHCPDLLALQDGRVAAAWRDLPVLLREILSQHSELSLQRLTRLLNERLYPESYCSSHKVRLAIRRDFKIRKTRSNHYDLPGGHQPPLPLEARHDA